MWPIPSCAWSRPLGSLPKIELRPEKDKDSGDLIGLNTLTRTKKGIPLGGIGAGNFMYNLCGSFGPWQMKVGRYEERFLSQAAFHVREELAGGEVKARTLATEDVLPAWRRLKPSEGQYHALFPKGWCSYTSFSSDISMQFFSPIIKDNYRETSYPAALFLFKIHNPATARAKLSLMFTFPNAPYNGPQNTPMGSDPDSTKNARRRSGLSNRVMKNSKSGVTAILMEAHDPENPHETEGTEWCIATSHASTYVPVWDGDSDGTDIWKDFAANGMLANQDLVQSCQTPAGALCHGGTRPRRQRNGAVCTGLVFSAVGVRFWHAVVEAVYRVVPRCSGTGQTFPIFQNDRRRPTEMMPRVPVLEQAHSGQRVSSSCPFRTPHPSRRAFLQATTCL